MKLVIKLQQLIMDSRRNFLSYLCLHWYKDKLLLCKHQKNVGQKGGPPKKKESATTAGSAS